ncbi:hypothetical protein FQA39_LY04195 [Lamprigera yunnana]|nr:hypothetical protein FQA39_LY04195 [Lamprigera yunnana]
MDVKAWVSKLPDPLLPTLFMDTESTTKNVPKTNKTDLNELQALCNDEWVECEPIQEETENHISPSTVSGNKVYDIIDNLNNSHNSGYEVCPILGCLVI